ncbi:MAG TPA: hypothetical protein EYF95_05335 [Flavobacteriales bacterium]|nr:hypothetical protein [Flavobacteriales bacterium]
MKVGDLVKTRLLPRTRGGEGHLGFIIEVQHPVVQGHPPDYRTPTAVLVHFSEFQLVGERGEPRLQQWFHKNELEMISEGG